MNSTGGNRGNMRHFVHSRGCCFLCQSCTSLAFFRSVYKPFRFPRKYVRGKVYILLARMKESTILQVTDNIKPIFWSFHRATARTDPLKCNTLHLCKFERFPPSLLLYDVALHSVGWLTGGRSISGIQLEARSRKFQ